MLKKIILPFICSILAVVSAAVFLFWFQSVPGVPGLLVWHPNIGMITTVFSILLLLCPMLFIIVLITARVLKSSVPRIVISIIDMVLSSVTVIAAAGLMVYCISNGNRMTPGYTSLNNPFWSADIKTISKVAVSSDPHWNNETSSGAERLKILDRVETLKNDAFFCLGDLSEWGDTKGGYEEPVKAINQRLKETPVFSIMGNHDALIAASNIFQTIFAGDKNAPLYYRMDYDNVHFIVLDMLWGAEELDKKQMDWLIETLESIPEEDKVVVMSHAFILSSGYIDSDYKMKWYDNEDAMEKLCPVFEKYKVDLVLSGHNHLMELLEKDGVTYVVIGAMGGKLDSVEYKSPYSLWYNNTSFGFLDLNFTGKDRIEMAFVDSDGKVLKVHEIRTN